MTRRDYMGAGSTVSSIKPPKPGNRPRQTPGRMAGAREEKYLAITDSYKTVRPLRYQNLETGKKPDLYDKRDEKG